MSTPTLAAGAALFLALAVPLYAGTATEPLARLDPAAASTGAADRHWSARAFLGAGVFDRSGQQVGEVTDLMIDGEGALSGLVVVADGWLGHLQPGRVLPMQSVHLASMQRVEVLSAEAAPSAAPDGSAWQVSLLMNDEARLADGSAYGRIEDVIFDGDGSIAGVVVERSLQEGIGGLHLWTYDTEGYRPGEGLMASAPRTAAPAPRLAASDPH